MNTQTQHGVSLYISIQTKTLSLLAVNVMVLGLANLFSGLFLIIHNVSRSVSSVFIIDKTEHTLCFSKGNRACLYSVFEEKQSTYSVFSCVSKHLSISSFTLT